MSEPKDQIEIIKDIAKLLYYSGQLTVVAQVPIDGKTFRLEIKLEPTLNPEEQVANG